MCDFHQELRCDTIEFPCLDEDIFPSSILCFSNLDLQITQRPRDGVVCPVHIRVACPVHRHFESAEKMSEREI